MLEELAERLRIERHGVCLDLMMITLDVLCNDFVMTACKSEFMTNMKEYGLSALEGSKLFAYLQSVETSPTRSRRTDPVGLSFSSPDEKKDGMEVPDV